MLNKALVLSLILLLFFSCKKEDRYITLSGKISDGTFGGAASSAKVMVKVAKVENGVYHSSYVKTAEGNCDANGNYSMEVKVENVSGYRIVVAKDNYFEEEQDITRENFESQDNYTYNRSIYPIGTIQLLINNTNPHDQNDQINFRFTNVEQSGYNCCSNEIQSGTGINFSYSGTCLVRGNRKIAINWVVSKKGNQQLYTDSIYAEAFKTTVFQINY